MRVKIRMKYEDPPGVVITFLLNILKQLSQYYKDMVQKYE